MGSDNTLFNVSGRLTVGLGLVLTALLVVSIWAAPSVADDALPTDCTLCHGDFAAVHGSVTHQATPGSGQVALFPDNAHDDAGWTGTKPYFAVTVDCVTCHNTYLPAIHSNDCSTCHPTPYDTLSGCTQGGWGGGCQQGGCHSVFHEDAFAAHAPFENAYDPNNDCTRCHDSSTWDVTQAKCLNCHATPVSGYTSLPLTTSDAQGSYNGPAQIHFSIKESGDKVGIGRTFYNLDGVPGTGSEVVVATGGPHTLEFWSVDQYGVSETSHNTVYFTVTEDTTPPTTTSNVQALYYNGGVITLSPSDDSALGVKNTYYTLNGGLPQTGTTITLPTTSGDFNYTLVFWSVDWAGNIEAQNTASFEVRNGYRTLKMVWGQCDTNPSECPVSGDHVTYTIQSSSYSKTYTYSGGSGWTGIDTYSLPLRPVPYTITGTWDSVYWGDGGDIGPTTVDFSTTDAVNTTIHY